MSMLDAGLENIDEVENKAIATPALLDGLSALIAGGPSKPSLEPWE